VIASGLATALLALESPALPAAETTSPLRQAGVITMPNVQGRIDHFNVDASGRRLFIAALGNHSIEVVNLEAGKWARSIPGVKKPQGVWYVPGLRKLFIADGEAGDVKVYRGTDLRLIATIPLDLGPDAEAYDPATQRLYVGYGGEDAGKPYGEVGVIDVVSDKHLSDIRTDAHPGAILVGQPGQTIFFTVPKTQEISAIDARTGSILATWKSKDGSPVSLAFDRSRDRLFVGTRKPAQVEVFDTRTHRWITSLPSVELMDGLYYDASHRRIYASGGEGYVAVYQQLSANRYQQLAKIPTGQNGRTSLWAWQLDRYFVALPADGGHGAKVMVYQPTP
jgi:DNA-binding beta-propeller fold protein YncE